MSGVIVVGDLHLDIYSSFGFNPEGKYNKLLDLSEALEGFIHNACKRKCSHIIFTGDIFDNRTTIHAECIKVWGEFLRKAKDNSIGVVVCQGNHDIFSANSSSLQGFLGMRLISSQMPYKVGDLKVFFIPYTQEPANILAGLSQGSKLNADVIIGHFGLGDVELQRGFCEEDLPFSSEIRDDGPLVLIGHYHNYKKVKDNVFYVGAPVGRTFAEANQKKVIFHVTKHNEFETIPVDWVRQLKQITLEEGQDNFSIDSTKYYYKLIVPDGVNIEPRRGVVKIERNSKALIAPEVKRVIGLSNHQAALEWITQNPPSTPIEEVTEICLRIMEDVGCL